MSDVTYASITSKEIAIELSGPHNENFLFSPAQKILRGEFLKSRLHDGVVYRQGSGLARVHRIPGQVIAVNLSERKIRITDPLGFRENAKLLKDLAPLISTNPNGTLSPLEEIVSERASDDQLATFLYWMKRYVEEGKAIQYPGSAPLPEKLPKGRVQVEFHASNPKYPRYLDEFPNAQQEAAA
jgi:hypothetical protein